MSRFRSNLAICSKPLNTEPLPTVASLWDWIVWCEQRICFLLFQQVLPHIRQVHGPVRLCPHVRKGTFPVRFDRCACTANTTSHKRLTNPEVRVIIIFPSSPCRHQLTAGPDSCRSLVGVLQIIQPLVYLSCACTSCTTPFVQIRPKLTGSALAAFAALRAWAMSDRNKALTAFVFTLCLIPITIHWVRLRSQTVLLAQEG